MLTTAVVGIAALGLGVVGVSATLSRLNTQPPAAQRCAAELNGTSWYLSPEQAQNAALFAAMVTERGLPPRALTISIATALQESRMVNIDYGDRDSVGLFQQRPSQGWGALEEIMDPVYSTGAFLDGLVKVRAYGDLPVTEAAQAVQRSGFPDAYAQHETRARAWASALVGQSAGTVTCALNDPAVPGDSADPTGALSARAARDFPSLQTRPSDVDSTRVLELSAGSLLPTGADKDALTQQAWALAHWAVAVALDQNVLEVAVADQRWSRETGTWASAESGPTRGTVLVTVA